MQIINNIKNWIKDRIARQHSSVWGRYSKRIMGLATILILAFNWNICHNIRQKSKQIIQDNMAEAVEAETKYIESIYQTNMQKIRHLFGGCTVNSMDEYLALADRFVNEHPDDYDGYVRITWPDGKSYTSDKGLDSRNFASYDIPRMILHENVPYVLTSPYKTMDKVEVKHYGIHFPLTRRDSIIAVITTTIPQEAIDEHISQLKLNGKGVPGIVHGKDMIVVFDGTSEGRILMRSQLQSYGYIDLDKALDEAEELRETGRCIIKPFTKIVDGKKCAATLYINYVKNSDWGISLAIMDSDQNHSINTLLIIMATLSILTILALYLTLRFITKRVVLTPIAQANTFAKDFSEGKLYSNGIDNIDSNNEFGELKRNMQDMRSKLANVLNNIKTSAQEINNGSGSLTSLMRKLEDGAQTQAVSTEEISASIEEISSSIQQINKNAIDASEISNEVSADISRIAQFSQTTLNTIENVINKIKVINDITQRTDLLAINASVEAARSGKAGDGFQQVASEIRKLAEVCQSASAEINTSSAQSLKVTQFAVSLISSMEPNVKENARMVSEISSSCESQIELTETMTEPIQQLVTVTAHNSNNAEELSQYVESLNETCKKLVESVEFFKFESGGASRVEILKQIAECNEEIQRLRSQLKKSKE